jgi:fucose permease
LRAEGHHGAAAGVLLFFTCVAAVVAPLMLGAAGDAFGDILYGYWLASGFAVLLFCGSILNWALNPTRAVLEQRDLTEYEEQNRLHRVERATRETASPIPR